MLVLYLKNSANRPQKYIITLKKLFRAFEDSKMAENAKLYFFFNLRSILRKLHVDQVGHNLPLLWCENDRKVTVIYWIIRPRRSKTLVYEWSLNFRPEKHF